MNFRHSCHRPVVCRPFHVIYRPRRLNLLFKFYKCKRGNIASTLRLILLRVSLLRVESLFPKLAEVFRVEIRKLFCTNSKWRPWQHGHGAGWRCRKVTRIPERLPAMLSRKLTKLLNWLHIFKNSLTVWNHNARQNNLAYKQFLLFLWNAGND